MSSDRSLNKLLRCVAKLFQVSPPAVSRAFQTFYRALPPAQHGLWQVDVLFGVAAMQAKGTWPSRARSPDRELEDAYLHHAMRAIGELARQSR